MEPENRRLEEWLDAALKRYGDAGPRVGLENRILARLHAEPARPSRWWWPVMAAAAVAAVIVGIRLSEDFKEIPLLPSVKALSAPPISKTRDEKEVAIKVGRRHKPQITAREVAKGLEPIQAPTVNTDQFPSPAPLSEQEEMLARYVREHYEQAVMMARAQTELRKRDALEENQPHNESGPIPRSPQEDERD